MAIIKTYEAVASTQTPTQAEFPALKHYFPCTETSGTTVTDTVGGVSFTVSEITGDGNKITAGPDASVGTTLASGAWSSCASVVTIQLVFGNVSNGGEFGMGKRAHTALAEGFTFQAVDTDLRAADDVSQTEVADLTVLDEDALNIFLHDDGTATYAKDVTAAGVYAANGTDVTVTFADFNTNTDIDTASGFCAISTGDSLYGWVVVQFAAVPDDLEEACIWMHDQWINEGNKAIWPGWAGKT